MNGDHYNHINYANILNDFPFLIFLLKLSSVIGVFLFPTAAGGGAVSFLMLIASIYPWYTIGRMSIHLNKMYAKFEQQHANIDDYTFIRPVIPFGKIPPLQS